MHFSLRPRTSMSCEPFQNITIRVSISSPWFFRDGSIRLWDLRARGAQVVSKCFLHCTYFLSSTQKTFVTHTKAETRNKQLRGHMCVSCGPKGVGSSCSCVPWISVAKRLDLCPAFTMCRTVFAASFPDNTVQLYDARNYRDVRLKGMRMIKIKSQSNVSWCYHCYSKKKACTHQ